MLILFHIMDMNYIMKSLHILPTAYYADSTYDADSAWYAHHAHISYYVDVVWVYTSYADSACYGNFVVYYPLGFRVSVIGD